MILKHNSVFGDSEVMRSLEKDAVKKGHFDPKPEEIVASAVHNVKANDFRPTDNLHNDIIKLTNGLRARGMDSFAEDIEKNIFILKTAETHLYRVHDEDGVDILNFAHPDGGNQMFPDAQDGLGEFNTLIGKHMKFLELVKKRPTGENFRRSVPVEEEESIEVIASLIKKAQEEPVAGVIEEKKKELESEFGKLATDFDNAINGLKGHNEISFKNHVLNLGNLEPLFMKYSGVSEQQLQQFKDSQGVIKDVVNQISPSDDYKQLYSIVMSGAEKANTIMTGILNQLSTSLESLRPLLNLPENILDRGSINYSAAIDQLNKLRAGLAPIYKSDSFAKSIEIFSAFNPDVAKWLNALPADFTKDISDLEQKISTNSKLEGATEDLSSLVDQANSMISYWAGKKDSFAEGSESAKNATVNLDNVQKLSQLLKRNEGKPFISLRSDIKRNLNMDFVDFAALTKFIASLTQQIKSASKNNNLIKVGFGFLPTKQTDVKTQTTDIKNNTQQASAPTKQTAQHAGIYFQGDSVKDMQKTINDLFTAIVKAHPEEQEVKNKYYLNNDGAWGDKTQKTLEYLANGTSFKQIDLKPSDASAKGNAQFIKTVMQDSNLIPKEAEVYDKEYGLTSDDLNSLLTFYTFLNKSGVLDPNQQIKPLQPQSPFASRTSVKNNITKIAELIKDAQIIRVAQAGGITGQQLDTAIRAYYNRAIMQGGGKETPYSKSIQKLYRQWAGGGDKSLATYYLSPENKSTPIEPRDLSERISGSAGIYNSPTKETGSAYSKNQSGQGMNEGFGTNQEDAGAQISKNAPFTNENGTPRKGGINIYNFLLSKDAIWSGTESIFRKYASQEAWDRVDGGKLTMAAWVSGFLLARMKDIKHMWEEWYRQAKDVPTLDRLIDQNNREYGSWIDSLTEAFNVADRIAKTGK